MDIKHEKFNLQMNNSEFRVYHLKIQKFLDAAARGDIDEITLRLTEGHDPSLHNGDGSTALHVASFHAQIEVVEFLIENCPSINPSAKNERGDTPLHVSVQNTEQCSIDVLRFLLKHGSTNSVRNSDGYSPSELAETYLHGHQQYYEILELLKTYNHEEMINDAAKYLGINIDEEDYLAWIAKEFVETPLPAGVIEASDGAGLSYYYNVLSGESTWAHPFYNHFVEEVSHQRRIHKCFKISTDFAPVSLKRRYFRRWAKDYLKIVWREKWGNSKAVLHIRRKVLWPAFYVIKNLARKTKAILSFHQRITKKNLQRFLPIIFLAWGKFAKQQAIKHRPTRFKIQKFRTRHLGKSVFYTWRERANVVIRQRRKMKAKEMKACQYFRNTTTKAFFQKIKCHAATRLSNKRHLFSEVFSRMLVVFQIAVQERDSLRLAAGTIKFGKHTKSPSILDFLDLLNLALISKLMNTIVTKIMGEISMLNMFQNSASSMKRTTNAFKLLPQLRIFTAFAFSGTAMSDVLAALTKYCKTISSLALSVEHLCFKSFEKCLYKMPHLESLTLLNCSNFFSPSLLPCIRTLLCFCPKLTRLVCDNCNVYDIEDSILVKKPKFSSENAGFKPDSILRALARGNAVINHLQLSGVQGISANGLIDLSSRLCFTLIDLNISFTFCLREKSLLQILNTMTRLSTLNLEYALCPGEYLTTKHFGKDHNPFLKLTKLKHLNVCNLTHVDSEDVVKNILAALTELTIFKSTWAVDKLGRIFWQSRTLETLRCTVRATLNCAAERLPSMLLLVTICLSGEGVKARHVKSIIECCPNLENIEFHDCHSIINREWQRECKCAAVGNRLRFISFRRCSNVGNDIFSHLLISASSSIERFHLESTQVSEASFLSVHARTLLQLKHILIRDCSKISLDIFADCVARNNGVSLENLTLWYMPHLSLKVLHSILEIRSLLHVNLSHCVFTNIMFRRLPINLKYLSLSNLLSPISKFRHTTQCIKVESDVEDYQVGAVNRSGIESVLSKLKNLVFVDIRMPLKEDQKWFHSRKKEYFEKRTLSFNPKQSSHWHVCKFQPVKSNPVVSADAMLPMWDSSMIGCTNVKNSPRQWYNLNVQTKLALLKKKNKLSST